MIRTLTALAALSLAAGAFAAWPDFVRDGRAGFVVSHIAYALGPDAEEAGTCPRGMTRNYHEIYAATPEGRRRPGESDEAYQERLDGGARRLASAPSGESYCHHPELAPPDPWYRTVVRSDVPVPGIDLDGRADPDDFPSPEGEPGVDNQFYRAVGCNRSYQSSGSSNRFNISMLTGSWGILFLLEGVDDLRDDPEVRVHFYANGDPIRLSPKREPLAYASYAPKREPRFHAVANGRIEGGMLRTEPVDMLFQNEVNSMYLDRPLRDGRLVAEIGSDGRLQGFLAGYTPVEEMYDMQFGYRDGCTRKGELAPERLRLHTAFGAAFVLGHTCHGAWQALHRLADGHPDPDGRFTTISTQYRIEAIPAFVIPPEEVAP